MVVFLAQHLHRNQNAQGLSPDLGKKKILEILIVNLLQTLYLKYISTSFQLSILYLYAWSPQMSHIQALQINEE